MARPHSVQLAAAAVDTSREERRLAGRRARYALRAKLWKLSNLPSVKGCARNVAGATAGGDGVATLVRNSETGQAGFAGLTLCQSVWACPCCSARIRADRARDVERAGVTWLRQDRALYFLTLTMPHDAGDALDELLEALIGAWRKLTNRKGWKDRRDRYGLRFIRAVEVTHTRQLDGGAGWHPHLHLLLFSDVELSTDARSDLLGYLESNWQTAVTSFVRADGTRFRVPRLDGIGVNLQDVYGKGGDGTTALLRYLSKVQDNFGESWSVGSELARGDLKTGRRALSRTPFELAALAGDGDPAALLLWHEYETATKGRKALFWSPGLRELLDCPETPAEDVPEVAGADVVVATIDAQDFRVLCHVPGLLVRLLELVECEDYGAVFDAIDGALEASRSRERIMLPA
jgi:hypothetical protein